MKTRLVTLLIAVVIALGSLAGIGVKSTPVSAMSQVIIGGYADALSKTANEYNSLMGGYTWTTTVANVYQCIPTGGSLSRLSIELSGVPGTEIYTFTLYLNGAATALTCDVAADGTIAIDTTHSVDVVAGDLVALLQSAATNPDNIPTARWSLMFEGDTANESILLNVSFCSSTATRYTPLTQGYNTSNVNEIYTNQVIPTGGTLSKMHVNLSIDPGTDPDAYTFKLRVNGADSNDGLGNPLSVTIVADNTTGNDVAHTITVSAGNYASVLLLGVDTPSSSPVVRMGMVFTATTDGESLILGQSGDYATNSQAEYNYLTTTGLLDAWSTTEKFQGGQAPTENMVLRKFYCMNTAAVAAAPDSWVVTIRGGGGSTDLTVTFQNTAAYNVQNDSAHTYTCAAYDDLAIMAVPADTPTAANLRWGLVCYIAPAAAFDISNTPSSKAFGVVATNTTYYAKGSAPANPVVADNCTFVLTNNGSQCDLDAHIDDFAGGVGWNIAASPAADEVKITLYYVGQNPASGLVLTNADQEWYDGLAASGNVTWDFSLLTGTGHTDGIAKSSNITITAVAED